MHSLGSGKISLPLDGVTGEGESGIFPEMADIEGEKMARSGQLDGVHCITVGADPTPSGSARRRKGAMHWLLVICSGVAYVAGTSIAILLSRFYFQQGGKSRWIQCLSQCIGWPLLLLPLMLIKPRRKTFTNTTLTTRFFLSCAGLGVLSAVDVLVFSWGVSFVSASTYTLLSATQLVFAAVFAFILVRHRITAYVLNSLVLLTLSAILLGVHDHSKPPPEGVSSRQFVLGFILTIVASALFGLILPLMQLVFTKVVGKETFWVVVETQLYVGMVASVISAIGLLASGEFRMLKNEGHSFKSGILSYYMTLAWTAIGSQISFLGALALTFLVSSLFSNVVNALSLPIVSIMAALFFKDNMDAIKIISMLLGLWGLASYIFGGYHNSKNSISAASSS